MKYSYKKTVFLLVLTGITSTQIYSVESNTVELSTTLPIERKAITGEQEKSNTHAESQDDRIPLDPTKATCSSRRKRQSIYKKKKVYMRDMTYEELRETKNQRVADNNIEAAIKYAEKMLPLCKDMHEQCDLMLELADLLFDNAEHEKAGKIYQEFVKLYPGTEAIEHASYRAILCCSYGILDSERDQSKTRETIELTTAFLDRSEIFAEHHDSVLSIQRKCYERLVESELNVMHYYLNNDRFSAAQTRINGMRKDYVAKMVDLEPLLLSTEIIIAEKQGKAELAQEKKVILAQQYPTFDAQKTIIVQKVEKSFADKF